MNLNTVGAWGKIVLFAFYHMFLGIIWTQNKRDIFFRSLNLVFRGIHSFPIEHIYNPWKLFQ